MSRVIMLRLTVATLCFSMAPALAKADTGADRLRIHLEGAAVWQQRNDFAVPGNTGTRVDLPGANDSPAFVGRIEAAMKLGDTWWGRVLLAPLSTTTTIVPQSSVSFQDAVFPAMQPLDVDYEFNSYRASVYRRFPWGDRGELRLGITAKIRDAKIALRGSGIARGETNVGFVPLVYAGAMLESPNGFGLDLDVDALGAAQGYAIDATLRGVKSLAPGLRLFAGYRILDGGADVDRVYSFGTFQYATAGVIWTP